MDERQHRPEDRIVVVARGRTERWLCCAQCSASHELLDPNEAVKWPCPERERMDRPDRRSRP